METNEDKKICVLCLQTSNLFFLTDIVGYFIPSFFFWGGGGVPNKDWNQF